DRADEAVHAVVLGVGDGHPPADAGRAEQFALEDGPDDLVRLTALEATGGPQALDHFADHALLGGGVQLGDDGVADHEIRDAHSWPPSLFAGLFGGGRAGDLAGRGRPAVVLDLFLVPAQLVLQLVHDQIDGGEDIVMAFPGHDVVLVLGPQEEFYDPGV